MSSHWTRGPRLTALALCQILWLTTATRAQSVSAPELAPPAPQEPAPSAADKVAPPPLDVAGYFAVRNLESDDLADRTSFREYSGSIFLSKTIGRWLFHSEINANTAPEWDSEGIHLFPATSPPERQARDGIGELQLARSSIRRFFRQRSPGP